MGSQTVPSGDVATKVVTALFNFVKDADTNKVLMLIGFFLVILGAAPEIIRPGITLPTLRSFVLILVGTYLLIVQVLEFKRKKGKGVYVSNGALIIGVIIMVLMLIGAFAAGWLTAKTVAPDFARRVENLMTVEVTQAPSPTTIAPTLKTPGEKATVYNEQQGVLFTWDGQLANDEQYVLIIYHWSKDCLASICTDVHWIPKQGGTSYTLPENTDFLWEENKRERNRNDPVTWQLLVADKNTPRANDKTDTLPGENYIRARSEKREIVIKGS